MVPLIAFRLCKDWRRAIQSIATTDHRDSMAPADRAAEATRLVAVYWGWRRDAGLALHDPGVRAVNERHRDDRRPGRSPPLVPHTID